MNRAEYISMLFFKGEARKIEEERYALFVKGEAQKLEEEKYALFLKEKRKS